jgi:hypothetical protein
LFRGDVSVCGRLQHDLRSLQAVKNHQESHRQLKGNRLGWFLRSDQMMKGKRYTNE